MNDTKENILEQAKIHYQNADFNNAKIQLERLIAIEEKAEYFSALAIIEKQLKNYLSAEKYYLKAIGLSGGDYSLYYNLGILYFSMQRYEDAVKNFTKSIELRADFHLSYFNRGLVYRYLEDYENSIKDLETCILLKPNFDDAYYNLGVINELIFNYNKALECYNKAIELNNDNVYAHWNKSLLLLIDGDYKNGFEEYEWRKKRKEYKGPNFAKPSLLGNEACGKKILIYDEQGLGDTIHFFRYLKMLKEAGCYLIFLCDKKLVPLLQHTKYFDEIIPKKSNYEYNSDYDYQISLLSLPLYFKTEVETIPGEIPYINVPENLINEWKEKIKSDKLKVGLCWAGNPDNTNDKNRSIMLNEFIPILELDKISFYSLQYDTKESDIEIIKKYITELKEDFLNTAAIIKNLDLVISVDTSIAHLAGALGKETWLLLSAQCDWRWLRTGEKTNWYPAMKIFRQEKIGEWSKVFELIRKKLIEQTK